MWYDLLPSFFIIAGCLVAPQFIMYGVNKFSFHGKPYRRSLQEEYDRRLYFRDARIAGDPYKTSGLSSIPDE